MQKNSTSKLLAALLLSSVLALTACGESVEKQLAAAQTALDKKDFNTATIQVKNVLQKNADNAQARFLFGQILRVQGDAPGAERELRKAFDAGYKPEKVIPLLVSLLGQQGKAKEALAEFASKQLAEPAAQAELAVALGDAWLAQKDATKATEQFQKALKAQPGIAGAELGMVRLKLLAEDADGAIQSLDALLSRQPKLQEAFLLKADILGVKNKADEAMAVLKQAIANQPEDKQAQLRMMSLVLQSGKTAEIEKVYEDLKKLAPNDTRTVYFGGVIALRNNKFAEARDAANKVLRVMPNHDLSLILLASASLRLGEMQQAETALVKVVGQRKDWLFPRRLLAEVYLGMRDPARALEMIKPALDAKNESPEVLNLAGQAYMLAGDPKRAAEFFDKVSVKGGDASTKTRLGMARMAAGDERGLQDLEAAAKEPNNILADAAIITAHLRKGDNAKALQALAALEKKQPENAAVANVRGATLLATKDLDGARKAFERALSLAPADIGAASQLAKLDLAAGKAPEARAHFERIVAKDAKNLRAWLMLAQLQQETGVAAADVRASLDKAVAADSPRGEGRLALVQYLLRTGEAKQALTTAQQAQAADPNNNDTLRLLARTQIAAGEKQQALTSYSKLQAADPKNPGLLLELADVQRANDDSAGAERSLRAAIAAKPDFVDAYQRLAGLLALNKRGNDAVQVARDLQKLKPEQPGGYLLEADVLAVEKRWPEVTAALQQAWQRAKTVQVLVGLRSALNLQGKTDEAQRLVNDFLKNNPKDVALRMQLADEALKKDKVADALALYKTIHSITPGNPIVLNNLAWTANKQGDAKALEYAEAALKAAPLTPAVMETVGTVLVDHKQAERGMALIKDALVRAPKAAEIRLGYARALQKTGDKANAKKEAEKALEGLPATNPLKAEVDAFLKTL